MTVSSMISPNGNPVANQFIITDNQPAYRTRTGRVRRLPSGTTFQSYSSTIAHRTGDKVYLGPDWDYSATTGRYRNIFLDEGIADTRRKIEDGTYKLLEFI